MRIAQEQVEFFMRRIGDPVKRQPEVGDFADGTRRHDLMREELHEYMRALENGDLVEIADALGDLAYTVLGTASHHGIRLQPIFNEVHRSNMTKTPIDHADPKYARLKRFKLCEKGPGYTPPRIAELLLIQSTGIEEA